MSALGQLARRIAAVTTGAALIAVSGIGVVPASAATVTPGWQPDANNLGPVYLYNAAGKNITSGSVTTAPMAAFYVLPTSPTATQGYVATSTPEKSNSATWSGTQQITSTQTFPKSSLPGDLAGFTGPVVADNSAQSLKQNQMDTFPNAFTSADPTYQNLYEIRFYLGTNTAKWYDADILVDTTAGTWTQVFPAPTGTTTTLAASPAGTATAGSTVTLTATVTSGAAGSVQFFDGATALGTPVAVSAGQAQKTSTTFAQGSHSFTATFTPTTPAAHGPSTSSATPYSITAGATAPAAPTAVSVTAGNVSASVSWTAPSTGGAPITKYTVTATPTAGSPVVQDVTTGTSTTVTGLTNGTQYAVTVTATNSVGTGPASSPAVNVTPVAPTAPAAPTAVTATPGNASASVGWTAPSTGGAPITKYTVTATPTVGSPVVQDVTSGTSTTVTGLTNGTQYAVTVTATNSVGTGPASSPAVNVTPAPTAPGVPTIGSATAGNTQATVTFTAPSSNGGSPVTGYTVTSTTGGKSATGTGSPITVPGLTNGTSYTFTVHATNSIGSSVESAASNSVTPATTPGAPIVGSATAGDKQASVTFTAPASNGGSPITGYTVTSTPGGPTKTGSGSPITVPGLTNGTAYTFTVHATNAVGSSVESAASNEVTPKTSVITTTLSLNPLPGAVVSGTRILLRGRLAGGAISDQTVYITVRPDHHPTIVLGTVTNPDGSYAFLVTARYNASYVVSRSSTSTTTAAVSVTRRVVARTAIKITSPPNGTQTHSRSIMVTGHVSPKAAGHLIYLFEVRNGRTLVLLSRVAVAADGSYRFDKTLTAGTHILQVTIGATLTNAAGASARIALHEI